MDSSKIKAYNFYKYSIDNMNRYKSRVHPLPFEWLVTFKNPITLWNENWFAVVFEIITLLVLYQITKHAKKQGSEMRYFIIASIVSTMCFELLPYMRPGYMLWWYHQGLINFLKQRLPSYAVCLFTIILYLVDNVTKKSNLPCLTRSLVTAVLGLVTVFPFLWLAPRLLLITYHFDDPVFRDNVLGVPCMELLILFLLFFHTTHLFQENLEALQPQERNSYNYVACALQSGLVAAIYTIIEQYVLYVLINLTLRLNSGFCVVAAITILAFLAKSEIDSMQLTSISTTELPNPLKQRTFWTLAAGFLLITTLPLWLNFSDLKSTNERLQLGPCQIMQEISNTNPLEITRRRFICPEDMKTQLYDLHCLTEDDISHAVKNVENWYTICGKRMSNYFQVAQTIAVYSAACLFIFHQLMRLSFTFKNTQSTSVEAKKVL